MVKSRRHRSRKRSRKRRGGGILTPSMIKACNKAGKKWHECAAHLAGAAKKAAEAQKATPNMMATVAQKKAMEKIAPVLKKKAKVATASADLMSKVGR